MYQLNTRRLRGGESNAQRIVVCDHGRREKAATIKIESEVEKYVKIMLESVETSQIEGHWPA